MRGGGTRRRKPPRRRMRASVVVLVAEGFGERVAEGAIHEDLNRQASGVQRDEEDEEEKHVGPFEWEWEEDACIGETSRCPSPPWTRRLDARLVVERPVVVLDRIRDRRAVLGGVVGHVAIVVADLTGTRP